MATSLAMVVVLFSSATVPFAQETPDPIAGWIRANAIPFATAKAGNGFEDLAGLERVIGDARIVSLGEPTRGTR